MDKPKTSRFLPTLYRYGTQVNTHDVVKVVATIGMFIDHIGLYLLNDNMGCRAIGRIAAPLFFFLVGYSTHYRFKPNILWYGIILTGITFFTDHIFFLNILINFVFIKAILEYYDPNQSSSVALSTVFFLLFIGIFFTAPWLEYGTIGLLFAIAGRLLNAKNYRVLYWLIGTIIVYFIYEIIVFNLFHSIFYIQLFWIICLSLGITLYSYRLRTWEINEPWRFIFLFTSRYSLSIYFFHLSFFKIYNALFKIS